jgi:hypothetical protein
MAMIGHIVIIISTIIFIKMITSINTVFINCSSTLEQFEVTDLFYLLGPLLGANFSLTINTLSLTLVTFFSWV